MAPLAAENVPAAQAVQAVAPVPENVPPPHVGHADEYPAEPEAVPAAQLVHAVEPMLDHVPAAQMLHVPLLVAPVAAE